MFFAQKTFTVESVTSGHPDKVCDQISDAILDECLKQDPQSRVAVEVFGSHGTLVIGGEVTTRAVADYQKVARDLYKSIGYEDELEIISRVVQQSPDIAKGVDNGGAGDQGIMYGYATSETPEFLPRPVVLVHQLAKKLETLRRENPKFSWLGPDGKTQITCHNNSIDTVLVSCQHDPSIDNKTISSSIRDSVIIPVIGDISGIKILVNPSGLFTIGGFTADTGLTGRKIMVDTYCGLVPHGGGCFSGKDSTKVDRSGAYMARYVAKQIVARGIADECLVSVAYAIGKAEPLMVEAHDGRGNDLSAYAQKSFDFRPLAIIEHLGLRNPIFLNTASYGHFGRKEFPWEKA
ncbi:MAG: methionine adenosyltransferase [Candidatus Yanofskybacteria bacterium RIFCSPHIGHO2_02_FULL_41_29]|uniref:Methionine adenosyltransferase n=1 Tax=Candidatus Yanofskybacteria bacterium RIFCSPHIGHO2_01_FULL_41_53 TaxID=1802663 RepID=A0A1F8EEV7_9BACT|nr:MAG: methionine adenosyltransferase [Candidatus Yanofskybacteria bacterium RIFCSPHIGHO2_01_FULL_41_53]OGN10458.1 MAG: methionine adenosyltransferase [Candidatus Yanofskybacteria bacterium RIFCSPHIGHO2_02_FULL_41_29]OGN17002.1 MAG: methionine adenosyltransferase [Candidatus Yanofskybacteria bacterium RIFCSPHIGHO2_12_FULL_41_9]OGN21406.1 MAG: methionine adenosyltransferase [Candidatus Yanofskybacteria bacterium RIFCSPLOWO2_01_FULL_41_67]OGN29251.1 MAG: methionine adenosyltransferase [Candidatu